MFTEHKKVFCVISETEPCSREMDPYSEIDDLTHLVGPLTESSIIKCLESRFSNHLYQVFNYYIFPKFLDV